MAYFNGTWSTAHSGELIDVLNPSDQREVVAQVPALSAGEVQSAYASAKVGAKAWRNVNAIHRGAVLLRASQLLRERADSLARLIVLESGKTLAEATIEVEKSADFFEFYGGLARLPSGYLLNDARPHTSVSVRREPIGVVLAITPWNDPLLTPTRKLAPALASGNAVVLKPASETPVIALELTKLLLDAGLVSNAITTITGRGRDLANALISAACLAGVTFTGSTATGLDLQRRTAGRNLRIQTEMGGKNAAVVLADANLELAADTVVAAAIGQGGQRCTATSRLILEESISDEFVRMIKVRLESAVLGFGLDSETTLGPLISRSHERDVRSHISRAVEEGATVSSIGRLPDGLNDGCFVAPTVVTGVERSMSIWNEEVFGPVIAVRSVSSLDDAIEAVNDSSYGLSSTVFTRSLHLAERFLEEVDTGQVAVNLPTSGWDIHHPFGGFGDSGSPFKEQGVEALNFYTRIKTCAVSSA